MKALRGLALVLAGCVTFVLGVLWFAPWENGAMYVMETLRLQAANAKSAVYITPRGLTTTGRLFPRFDIAAFDIEHPISKITFSNLGVRVLPISSLLSGSVVCDVEWSGAEIRAIPNQTFSLGEGSVRLYGGRDEIRAARAAVTGDIQLAGNLAYDRNRKAIRESTMTLKVPDNLNVVLRNPMLSRYLESTTPGEWRIKTNAAPTP